MADFPRSLLEFQRRFPIRLPAPLADRGALAGRLRLPACGGVKGWALATRPGPSSAPLPAPDLGDRGHRAARLEAAADRVVLGGYLMATHSNGISALQLQKQLGLGSYKTAGCCAQAAPRHRSARPQPLAGLVEVDETTIPCRSDDDPLTGGGGRSRRGKMPVAGAVEVRAAGRAASG